MESSKRNIIDRLKYFLKVLYEKLVKINDSPHRTALGFGLGVFLGIFPGAGPVASLVLAAVFRVNKAAALLGSVLTNTWLSFVTFLLAVKAGSFLTGCDWRNVYDQCELLVKDFHWKDLWDVSILKILMPLIVGYVIVGLAAAFVGYLVVVTLLKRKAIKG
ncbi:MAG TPA: DUF2062 domain-containing protein [Candidatus Omnitrophota bacterium]|nr:DUF2062 domain-containing protein [Candidatus Omnitrophota bacterium]HPD84669.1 DUF2062 domain-containing protein [Candidatus Omnitrophota bacterium]HRZ03527.1 DUF2062 domain-containing protein [Candidatus Omnitrophota bacterium]